MKKATILAVVYLFNLNLFADVYFSMDYKTPISTLEKIAKSLKQFSERDQETMELPIFYSIADGISLLCEKNLPGADLQGCRLSLKAAKKNEDIVSTSFVKPLDGKHLVKSIEKMKELILDKDPNTTENPSNVGNPFNEIPSDATHFFCEPKGEKNKKKWACSLFVAEAVRDVAALKKAQPGPKK